MKKIRILKKEMKLILNIIKCIQRRENVMKRNHQVLLIMIMTMTQIRRKNIRIITKKMNRVEREKEEGVIVHRTLKVIKRVKATIVLKGTTKNKRTKDKIMMNK
jgi:hypothetical protein